MDSGPPLDPYAASALRSRARREAARRQAMRRRRARRVGAGVLGVVLLGLAAAYAGLGIASNASRVARAGPARASAPAAAPAGGRMAGVWLVPAGGPQLSVRAENALPGTRSWRLPGPAADVGGLAHGSVVGYALPTTALPGMVERLYISAPGAAWVRVRIYRIGWYHGAGGREVFAGHRVPVTGQPPCTHFSYTGLTVCHWRATLRMRLPSTLASGVYLAKLITATGERDLFFVVRALRPQPLLAQLPTATYEAYNAWGGDSLYPGGADAVGVTGTTQGVEVSYARPYDSQTGAGQFFARDVAMVWFLERAGVPASYTTSESVDAHPAQLSGHRALLDFGHSEYWSARQVTAWRHAMLRGTSLLFLSSDTLGWRVRFAQPTGADAGPTIVAYKEYAVRDPDAVEASGVFPDRGAALTGSAYLGCITPRIPIAGPPTYHYYAWAPAPGLEPAWLFAGTGITATTRIPGIVGYEIDERTALTPARTRLVGAGVAPCMTRHADEPGEPIAVPGDNLAETTLTTAASGATVFSTGTLGWELGLAPVPSASPDAPRVPDSRLVRLTRNLLTHVLGGDMTP